MNGIYSCEACESKNLLKVLDLGEHPLCDDLIRIGSSEKNEEFPDAVTQEELLDKKKRERDKLGSVNLRADEETSRYQNEIEKMNFDSNYRESLIRNISCIEKVLLNNSSKTNIYQLIERLL